MNRRLVTPPHYIGVRVMPGCVR